MATVTITRHFQWSSVWPPMPHFSLRKKEKKAWPSVGPCWWSDVHQAVFWIQKMKWSPWDERKFCTHSCVWQAPDFATLLWSFRSTYLHLKEWLLSCAAPCLLSLIIEATLSVTVCLASYYLVTRLAWWPEMGSAVLFCGAWWPHHQLINHHTEGREKGCIAEL